MKSAEGGDIKGVRGKLKVFRIVTHCEPADVRKVLQPTSLIKTPSENIEPTKQFSKLQRTPRGLGMLCREPNPDFICASQSRITPGALLPSTILFSAHGLAIVRRSVMSEPPMFCPMN